MDDRFDISRRKVLAALGTVGVASAGAGLGTSAYFSDQETFENNQLTAGTLDMKVSWAEHYSDWSEDEAEFASMEDGELVIEDREGFMNATLQEQFPDEQTRSELESGDADPCEVLADVPDDLDKPVVQLDDVKPGDFGEVTFDFALCDNPGYVWLNGSLLDAAENGLTEPEADDPDEEAGTVELLDEIQVTVWYDDGDNVLEDTETIVTDREFEPNPISSAIAVSGEDRIIAQGTLREVLNRLSVENGIPLDANPTTDDRDCFTNSPTIHYVGFAWELPVDHANEIQSDSATFDLGFYTEQCRHNDGETDLTAYYPLEGSADDESGNEYDGTINGDVSFTSGQVGQAASFDGDGDYVTTDLNVGASGESMTISGWLKAPTQPIGKNYFAFSNYVDQSHNGFFAIGTNDGDGMFFWVRDSNVANSVQTGAYEPAFDGNWHHYAGVRDADADEIRFYIDGELKETLAFPGDAAIRDGDSFFGLMQHYGNRNLEGDVDDVRIYSRALSASEVQDIYDSA